MRGTRRHLRCEPSRRRFIPASAGNARHATGGRWRLSVHPRECGERLISTASSGPMRGSSPRVRGTQPAVFLAGLVGRFIPASAGNAYAWIKINPRDTVHPRECGERPPRSGLRGVDGGSSPRVRGTQRRATRKHRGRRFIPSSAGNADPMPQPRYRPPAHPRECGERGAVFPYPAPEHGSSPRVRGTRPIPALFAQVRRFIPASAGNARSWEGLRAA